MGEGISAAASKGTQEATEHILRDSFERMEMPICKRIGLVPG